MEFRLLAAVLVAVAAAAGVIVAMHRADPKVRRAALDLVATGLLGGIVVGRVWAMLASGTNPVTHPLDLLIVRGGVDTVGATLGALAAVAWAARSQLLASLDALAPGAVFGLAGWHAGCMVRTACLGTPTTLPWGWPATPGGPDRHPVEIYTALLLIGAGLAVRRLWRRHPGTGRATALALFGAATARALTEPLRPVLGDGLMLEYLVGAGLALALCLVAWRRQPTADSPQPTAEDPPGGPLADR